jgi:hypothetical protein
MSYLYWYSIIVNNSSFYIKQITFWYDNSSSWAIEISHTTDKNVAVRSRIFDIFKSKLWLVNLSLNSNILFIWVPLASSTNLTSNSIVKS